MPHKHKPGWVPGPGFSTFFGPTADATFKRDGKNRVITASTRKGHKKDKGKTPGQKCPCEAFRLCDLRFQQMTKEERDIWYKARKKPGQTAYTLWMKECISLAISTAHYPLEPSCSGGFTCSSLVEGPAVEEPGFIGQVPPPTRYHCSGPPHYNCNPDPMGEYANLIACLNDCRAAYCLLALDQCVNCMVNTTPAWYRLTLAGLTGICAQFNMTIDLSQEHPLTCRWNKWHPTYVCKLVVNPTYLLVQLTALDGYLALVDWRLYPLDNCTIRRTATWYAGTGSFSGQTEATGTFLCRPD